MRVKLGVLVLAMLGINSDLNAKGLSQCPTIFYANNAPIVSNKKLSKDNFPLCFQKFAVNYSGVSKTPIWAAEFVTFKDLQDAKKIKREDNFHEEDRIPSNFRSKLSDYRGSGFDRGHMVPNGTRSNKTDQFQSFSLVNIIPQAPKNNQEQWRNLEEATRTLVSKNKSSAYMITGPLYLSKKVRRIGDGVLVPSHIYKVVYFPKEGVMSAYVSVNDNRAKTDVVSVAELQKQSQIVFFPRLNGSPLIHQKYALPLSANAAYKMRDFQKSSSSSSIFEMMPDEENLPSAQRKNAIKKTEDISFSDIANKAKRATQSFQKELDILESIFK